MSIPKNLKPYLSVIIPTFNESRHIVDCLKSLKEQVFSSFEIIVVDDGSKDNTWEMLQKLKDTWDHSSTLTLLTQKHKGPGQARNHGARRARGKILVFVDADMTFDNNFLKKIIQPIEFRKAIGTGSQEEYLKNPGNFWAKSWHVGRFAAAGVKKSWINDLSMTPNRNDYGGIYRAILRRYFNRVGGFDKGGDYTDDESLARKLGVRAVLAKGAKYFHKNPESFVEVFQRALWIGTDRKYTETVNKKIINLIKFCPPMSLIKGIIIGLRFNYFPFVFFKLIYDLAVWLAVIRSI